MSDKRKEATAAEAWNSAVREAYTETPEEASDEQIEQELRAGGVDLDAWDADGAATYDAVVAKLSEGGARTREPEPDAKAVVEPVADEDPDDVRGGAAWVSEAPPANVVRMPTRRRTSVWVAATIAAAAAAGGTAYVLGHHGPPPPPEHPVPDVPTVDEAPPPSPVAPAPPAPLVPSSSPHRYDKR